jgi:peptide/nickel transport system substrate-binding protein
VNMVHDILSLDAPLSPDLPTFYVAQQLVEGLVGLKLGTLGEMIPVLAAEMPTISADGKTYTFKLRTGVKFHDGTDFNCDAVKYNYDRLKNMPPELQNTYEYYYAAVFGGYGNDSNIVSTECPDQQTAVFTLKQPQSNFLISQTLVVFGIQSPTALAKYDANNPDPSKSAYYTSKGMVGTGPFKLKEWVPGDHVGVVKNPDYWDTTRAAHLDAIQFKGQADATASLNALQAGDVDLVQLVPASLVDTVKSDSALQLVQPSESCNTMHLGFTQTNKPVDNLNIRLAIAYALNRPDYVKAFFGEQGLVPDNWMPPTTQFYIPLGLPSYDPEKAKEEIAKSGLSGDGLNLELWYPAGYSDIFNPDPKSLHEAMARDLTAVGFNVIPHAESASTGGYFTSLGKGLATAWQGGWGCDWAGIDNYLQAWLGAAKGTKTEFGWTDPKVSTAIDNALAATDPNLVKQYWEEAQRLVASDMPSVPIVHALPASAAKAYVKDYQPGGNFMEALWSVWLDK